MLNFNGRSVLVTGSSSGIGLAVAQALEAAGSGVVYHGSCAKTLAAVGITNGLAADLLSEGGAEQLIADAFDRAPEMSLLVCNAGAYFDVPFLEMTRERFGRTMRLNVEATYFLIQSFARRLRDEGRKGAVVVTTSVNGSQSEMDSTAYDMSKGALNMLIRSCAQSLAPHGIRVNGVAPGLIRTAATAWLDERPEVVRYFQKRIPLERVGTADECAGAYLYLLSDLAAYVTGEIITVDGGMTSSQLGTLPVSNDTP